MLGQKILPAAMLAALPAAAALTVPLGQATADECRTNPGSTASPGQHWFYHINRPDHRHCWYLSSAETEQRSHARRAILIVHRPLMRRSVVATESVQPDDDQQPSSTYPGPDEATVQESLPSMNFASRWAKFSTSQNLPAHDMATIGYVDANPVTNTDKLQFIGPADDNSSVRPQHVFRETLGFFLLVAALLVTLPLLAVALLKIARAPPASDSGRLTTPNKLGYHQRLRHSGLSKTPDGRLLAGTQTSPPAWRSRTSPDPSEDFNTDLQELMGALRRASAGPYTLRSFAPVARSRRASRS